MIIKRLFYNKKNIKNERFFCLASLLLSSSIQFRLQKHFYLSRPSLPPLPVSPSAFPPLPVSPSSFPPLPVSPFFFSFTWLALLYLLNLPVSPYYLPPLPVSLALLYVHYLSHHSLPPLYNIHEH